VLVGSDTADDACDSAGHAVPSAKVSAKNVATGQSFSTESGSDGMYSISVENDVVGRVRSRINSDRGRRFRLHPPVRSNR